METSSKSYLLTIDQGTTSSRVLLIDHDLRVLDVEQREHRQISLYPGWCEHDPQEIVMHVTQCVEEVMKRNKLSVDQVKALAITNQRETVVAFDRVTGKALHNAIVWLDKRTSGIVKHFIEEKNGGDSNAYR